MQTTIESKLQNELNPSFLNVINESHMHNVPPGSESHFKVIIVSDRFDGKGKVARHQMVYKSLAEQMSGGIHALALHTYTASEWQQRKEAEPESTRCHGGH